MSLSRPAFLTPILVAGTFVLAAPAAAQEEAADPAAAETTGKAESDELICRTENVIGSRAKKRRTCLTRQQWERVARKGNAFARKLVSDNAGGIWDGAPDPGS